MTSTMLPTTTDTPTMRAPADLQPGDFISADYVSADEPDGTLAEIVNTYTSRSALHGVSTLVVYRLPDGEIGSEPFGPGDELMSLATADEVAQAKQDNHRRLVATQLRQLADLIVRHELPVGDTLVIPLSVGRVDLDVIAAKLGTTVTDTSSVYHRVSWPVGAKSYDDGVYVDWHANAPEPELVGPREPDNGDQPAPVPAGVDAEQVGSKPARKVTASA